MRKKFTLLLTVLFTLFTLPFSSLTVFAAEDEGYEEIKNGTYDITAKALNADKDEKSAAAGFIEEDATINIVNGKAELIIKVKDNDMATIDWIKVEGNESEVNRENSITYHKFELVELKEVLNSRVMYSAPDFGINDHNVPLRFVLEGLDDLPIAEPEYKEETETEKVPFETVEETDSTLDKGDKKVKQEGKDGTKKVTYKVTYVNNQERDREILEEDIIEESVNEVILVGEKESSSDAIIKNPDEEKEYFYQSEMALDRHFNNPVKLIKKDDKEYLQITGNGGQYIDSLLIDGKEAVIGEVAEDGAYTMQFEVTKSLSKKLNFKMKIDTGNPDFGMMEHETNIWFTTDKNPTDTESKTESVDFETVEKEDSSLREGKTKVKQKGVKGEKEITYEITYMAGKENTKKVKDESITKKPVDEIILVGTKPIIDGTYDIIAKAMHATEDKESGAAAFINEDAQIVIKDGVIQLVITVPHGELAKISGMQVEKKEASIQETKEGKIYTFTLKSLKEVLDSRVQYEVPSLNIDHDVPFRFVLEGLDKLPIKVEKEPKKEPKEDPSDEDNGDNGDNGTNGNDGGKDTPGKPEFGSNDEDETTVPGSNDEPKNPKTGDTSAIMFYALLLIGSLIPLAIKFKRRFV